MRVKKYKRELEQYEKAKGTHMNEQVDTKDYEILQKLIKEKEDLIKELTEENKATTQQHKITTKELGQLANQVTQLQKAFKNMQNEMLILRDELMNRLEQPLEKQNLSAAKGQSEASDLLELKQQLVDIQSLIKSANNYQASPQMVQPYQTVERRPSAYTFRDLQAASRIRATSNMNNRSPQAPSHHPRMLQNSGGMKEELMVSHKGTEETHFASEQQERVSKQPSLQGNPQMIEKEKNLLSAFSFLKKMK